MLLGTYGESARRPVKSTSPRDGSPMGKVPPHSARAARALRYKLSDERCGGETNYLSRSRAVRAEQVLTPAVAPALAARAARPNPARVSRTAGSRRRTQRTRMKNFPHPPPRGNLLSGDTFIRSATIFIAFLSAPLLRCRGKSSEGSKARGAARR
eukprot:gene16102-biopygen9729